MNWVDYQRSDRIRSRNLGLAPGIFSSGGHNSITDVKGVRVGHFTLIKGDDIRTGATAILPHGGNLFQEKVPAGLAVANGFGKILGATQIQEMGEIETPIVLTNTLAIPQAAEAIIDWSLKQPGNEEVRSINPIVGETNDGKLNNIRKRALTPEMFLQAIRKASEEPVQEGCVGAGTGTMCFGWKGGIGTSSRVLPASLGGFVIGVLVQTNFEGVLSIMGVPVGKMLGKYYLKDKLEESGEGSIMIIVATDAPLSDRNLCRLAQRTFAGLARTGASMTNGSGDYAIAFSTAEAVRRTPEKRKQVSTYQHLPNEKMSPLFQAAIEATEEAIYNSLFTAKTLTGYRGKKAEALPLDRVREMFQKSS